MAEKPLFRDMKAEYEAAVAEKKLDNFEGDGLVILKDGVRKLDRPEIGRQLHDYLFANSRAETREDRESKLLTPGKLAKFLLPSAPGANGTNDLDEVEQEAWTKSMDTIWNFVSTTGLVQKLFRSHPDGIVVVPVTIEADGRPNAQKAVYVTSSSELLELDYYPEVKRAYLKAADRYGKRIGIVADHKPELRAKVSREVANSSKSAGNAAKTALELTMGTSDDE